MSARHVCFSHGRESGPWGTKIRALAEVARGRGWSVESLDYSGMDGARERIARLAAYCRDRPEPIALAGSSMGGYVSAAVAAELPILGMFLMAPAFYVPGFESVPPAPARPVTIVHGWRDEVVPWEGSVRYAAPAHVRLVLLDGDHRLTASLREVAEVFAMFLREIEGADQGARR
jgi:alpha/beta superfamily hydrolase